MHVVYQLPSRLFFCLFFIHHVSTGQLLQNRQDPVPGYDLRYYTGENGLPQNSVKSIVADLRGNIWLATEKGLVRFDGSRFVNFDNFGGSLGDLSISGFYLDPQNPRGDPLAMTNNRTWIRIADGKAAVDTSLKGYPLQRSANFKKNRDPHLIEALPDLNEQSLTHYRHVIAAIYPSANNRHFAYDDETISYYANNRMLKRLYLPGKGFFRFFCLGENLYHLDEKLNLTCFYSAGPDFRPKGSTLSGPVSMDEGYKLKQSHRLFWNSYSNQAFLSFGHRLYYLQPAKNGSLTSVLVLDGFDFQATDIKTVYFDRHSGRLFLGSQLHGLYILAKKKFRPVTDPSGKSNTYYGQSLLDEHRLLTTRGSVFSLDSANLGAVAGRLNLLGKTVDWDQYSVLRDRAGTIWCKRRETLFRFDGSGKRIISTWTLADEIKVLYEGRDGRIWIGTNTLGLYYIDPSDRNAQPRFFAGRHLSNISWIQYQNDQILWIGTGKGLYKIDLVTRKLSYIKGLSDIYIRSLYIPGTQNEIWITTYTNGIFLLKNNRLTRFPLDKKQYLANAHCIFADKNGFFWVTTNKGLFQIKRSDLLAYAQKPFELYYHYYSKADGFNTNEFNGGCQPCAVRTPGGLISVPSIDGLVWFVPELTRPELSRGQIFVDDSDPEDSSFVWKGTNISVAAGVPQMIVKVTTPYFGDPYNLRMSYRIFKDTEPLTDWKALDDSKGIAVPFHGGGSYKLSIRKLNGFGIGNCSYGHLNIHVEKRWHETWLFRVALALAALLLFYGIFRRRISDVKRQNLILEAKVKERTEHLEKTLGILSHSERQLEQQVRLHVHMIASISHDIRTPVRHMSFALDYTRSLLEENKLDTAVTFMKQLKQAVDQMYHMVDNIVNFIKPEVHGTNVSVLPVRLHEVITQKVSLFRQVININQGAIRVDVPPGETVFTEPRLLAIIIHNLIDNAIKAQHGNTLDIYTEHLDGELHLTFEDNGPGMPAELMQWLNARDQEENAILPAGYEGLGLLLLKQISRLLRINVYVTNKPGACIRLVFTQYEADKEHYK